MIENSIKTCKQNKSILEIGYNNVNDQIIKEFGEIYK